MKSILYLSAALIGFFAQADDESIKAARSFLENNAVISSPPHKTSGYEATVSRINAKPDPESKFGYIVFSIARHSQQLLSPDQAHALDTLIEARKNAEINWHDVRNLIRVCAQIALWDYAMETDPENATELNKQWQQWSTLRLDYMFEEFADKERFQRAAWNVLTDAQRNSLRAGEWDQYMKKSTGHGRLFSADKQIARVLGKPNHPAAFNTLLTDWQERWQTMWDTYQEAAAFERKREFSMDIASEAFSLHAWKNRYAPAFRAFAEHECEALRQLLQTGYQLDETARGKLNQHRAKLRTDALKKYKHSPEELLNLLRQTK
ncbi:MAG: hypothetical protein P1V20_11965 [Verrucomicrobiales bacterium]|nr:hypothetical protein [Verrucomicrobiales bacterium]